jgi:hypothetical protein
MNLKPLFNVKLIEQNKQHYYQLGDDETWKPGVTTVLKVLDKPALIPWATKCVSENIKEAFKEFTSKPLSILTHKNIERICDEGKNIYKKKAADAADIGSRVHQAIDSLIRGEIKDIAGDIKAGVQGFLDWEAANSLKIHLGDSKLGSKLFGYGGSLDFVAFDGNDPIIFDIKTTKRRKDRDHGVYPEYGVQLAAYGQAFYETYGLKPKALYALWVNKEKPEFKAVKVANPDICFEMFLACLKIHKIQKLEMFEEEMILI